MAYWLSKVQFYLPCKNFLNILSSVICRNPALEGWFDRFFFHTVRLFINELLGCFSALKLSALNEKQQHLALNARVSSAARPGLMLLYLMEKMVLCRGTGYHNSQIILVLFRELNIITFF